MEATVIIPTFRHSKALLTRAIESVVSQTIFSRCRVIVSDDCSGSGTFRGLASEYSHLENIEFRENASNKGIMPHYSDLSELVSTEFTAILEGDDCWEGGSRLERQISLLRSFANSDLCFGRVLVDLVDKKEAIIRPVVSNSLNRLVHFEEILSDNYIATFSNCTYRTAAWKSSVQAAQDGYDWLTNLLVIDRNPAIFLNDVITRYHVTASGSWSGLLSKNKKAKIALTLSALANALPQRRLYISEVMRAL
ncbi:MAG: glycosyltransferase family A protein [Devosia sp.]